MALTITQQDNTIFLDGVLNTANIVSFKKHFSYILESNTNMTLNIENVESIDITALQVLKVMYSQAIMKQNMFFVEGKNSETIYETFSYPNVA